MNPHRRAFITSLVLLAAAGAVAGTSASFNAKTTNDAAFSTDGLNNPTSVTATVAGNTVGWSWTAGFLNSGGSDFNHRLSTKALAAGTLAGVAPTCTWSDSFTTTSTIPNATTNTTIATSSTNAGAWLCWRLDVQSPVASPAYFSQNSPTGSVKIGHAVASVAIANGGTAGTFDPGDTFTITFTQPVVKSTGPTDTSGSTGNGVCIYRSGGSNRAIHIGRSATPTTACNLSETTVLGSIAATGLAVGANTTAAYNASYTWGGTCSGDNLACTQLTVLVGSRTSGSTNVTSSVTTALFDPTTDTAKLKSATGNLSICTTTNNTGTPVICHPQITGSF